MAKAQIFWVPQSVSTDTAYLNVTTDNYGVILIKHTNLSVFDDSLTTTDSRYRHHLVCWWLVFDDENLIACRPEHRPKARGS